MDVVKVSSGEVVDSSETRITSSDFALEVKEHTTPLHVYNNEWFSVRLCVKANRQSVSTVNLLAVEQLHFKTSLHLNNDQNLSSDDITADAKIEIDPESKLTIDLKKPISECSSMIRCRINDKNVNAPGIYAIRFFIPDKVKGKNSVNIDDSFASNINIVKYKLIVITNVWESVWYKDEGGRDKCMQVDIGMESSDQAVAYDKRVPLKLNLKYDGPQMLQVVNQSLLRTLGSPAHYIDPDTGKANIRFRIEDVSKNHQGQSFIVEICADSTKYPHVAPGYTRSVSVRSKRNKRPSPVSDQSPNIARDVAERLQFEPIRNVSSSERSNHDRDHRQIMPFVSSEVGKLRQSVQGVLKWTEEVIGGLYPLQWEVIGYATFPDGSPDYSHPYHSMPNPNASISRILSMYTDTTREQLGQIVTAVDRVGERSGMQMPRGYFPRSARSVVRPASQMNQPFSPRGREGYSDNLFDQGGVSLYQTSDEGRSMQSSPSHTTDRSSPIYPSESIARPERYSGTTDRSRFSASHLGVHRRPASQENEMMATLEESSQFNESPGDRIRTSPVYRNRNQPRNAQSVIMAQDAQMTERDYDDNDESECDVHYVLVKEYSLPRSSEPVGFPAYNSNCEVIGFYRESSSSIGISNFTNIIKMQHKFSPSDILELRKMLRSHIDSNSQAVYNLTEFGSVANLLDQASVFNWSTGT
mmetsp:Transcript_31160/g.35953  ORF Transcript_31160/g.35953 Transcript_31160/m.35953 type:complete len:698 (+) Transcript_31160:358-2451(+)